MYFEGYKWCCGDYIVMFHVIHLIFTFKYLFVFVLYLRKYEYKVILVIMRGFPDTKAITTLCSRGFAYWFYVAYVVIKI